MNRSSEFADTFRQEAMDLLADMEDAALDLEADPENGEPVGRIFRYVHTIKGSGAMFGFEGVARFAHRLESLPSHCP